MVPATDFWTPARFAEVTGGRWLSPPLDAHATIGGVSIDSRSIEPGEAFVAIAGERFDGHRFLDDVAAKGAGLAIVEQATPALLQSDTVSGAMAILQVRSTLDALHRLASEWRDRLGAAGCRIISVTGSNGKTTTRHLIHQVLTHAGRRGSQSPKSFNNQIGVPLTLLAADADQDFLVAEIGTNHPGEIAALAALVRPDIAVLTSIGEEHLEFFHDLAGVAAEESQVFEHLAADGIGILPVSERLPVPLSLPAKPAFRIQRFDLDPITDGLPLPGMHNRLNASAASAVARCFGIDESSIAQAWSLAQPAPMRGEVLWANDPVRPTVINDAYNANPTSMRAALEVLHEHPAPRWAVLGDMLELGEMAASAHREIAAEAANACEHCILIGPLFDAARRSGPPSSGQRSHLEWSEALGKQIATELPSNATLLIKGSRGMALERLLPLLEAKFERIGASA